MLTECAQYASMPGAGDAVVNKAQVPASQSLQFSEFQGAASCRFVSAGWEKRFY